MYDLIIIGGGPAGITAGIYAARQGLKSALFTKEFGGQLAKKSVDIENYPGFEKISGQDLIKRFENHLRKHKIEIIKKEINKVEKKGKGFLLIAGNDKYQARAVIVSSGGDPRPSEVPGEKEFIGKGVSYCSICDGPVFRDKIVAIIGGGNAGFETAMFLSNYVPKIYIMESGPKAAAYKMNQESAIKTGKIEIITNARLKEIKGDKMVDSIVYEDLKTKKIKTLDVKGVFVEIGTQPATAFVKELVDFNEKDEIKVEPETCATKTPGLFAAGDLNIGKYKQIVTACGEGAKAALAAYEYIKKND